MNFHVMTLFPEMIEHGLNTSITGKAIENGRISLNAVNIRNFSKDKHLHVDDYPYGGGAGMVMQPQPVYDCYEFILNQIRKRKALEGSLIEKKPRVIYMTPQGDVFTQKIAESLSKEEDLIFLCGHYEGIDERVLEEIVTDNLSIGDYVLTGGELPAMVMIDTISRLVPGVLSNDESAMDESFQDGLLEYPQYTRPPVFHDKKVPDVLLTGNHIKIEQWRREKSVERTLLRRPDLLETAQLDAQGMQCLSYIKGKSAAKDYYANIREKISKPDELFTEFANQMIFWGLDAGRRVLSIGLCTGMWHKKFADYYTLDRENLYCYGIEALDEGIGISDDITKNLEGKYVYDSGIFSGLEKLDPSDSFDAVILPHIFDRLYPKDSKKLLKKIVSLTHKDSRVCVILSSYIKEDEFTKFVGKHMVETNDGAVYNLTDETWRRIFMPYFKVVQIAESEVLKSGEIVRIFELIRKM